MANEFRVKNGIICGGDIVPDGDSTRDLGTSSLYFAEGYIDKLFTTGNIELGHATDTTIARSSAGVITVEGVVVPTVSSTSTLTNKTLTSPVLNTGVSGTAVKDEDNMASDSATHLASQQSIKAYVDANGGLSLIDEDDMASNSATRPPSQQSVVEYVQAEVGSAGGGDITSVVAGTGLSGGATSGAATLNMKTDLVYGPTGDQTQRNLGLGENAMNSITQFVSGIVTNGGSYNTGVGYNSGTALTTGDGNSFYGYASGDATTTAGYNTGIGYNVLTTNITGHSNVAVGYASLDSPDAEDHNIAIGYGALGGSIAGGEYNIAIGSNALDSLTISDKTVAIGHNAGHAITGGSGTNGSENTLIGYQAGDALTTAENCVIIGSDADASAVSAANQIVIGKGAVGLADNSVVLGNTDITAWLPPDDAGVDLGSASYQFKDAYIHGTLEADAITIGGTGIGSIYSPVAGHSSIATVGTIGTGTWQGTAIAGGYIANDAIDSQHYADGSIDNAHIADNAIDSEHYADGSIDNAHIADDAIDSEHYAAASIDFAHIQNVAANSILGRNANSSGVLSEVALTTTQILIGDGTGFTAAALSGDATMTNAGVVSLAANSVDSDQYVDGSIDNAHLADDAVNSDELAAGAVDDAHLSDGVATGLAGTGTTATSGVLNVIGGTGITANANDIAIDSTVTTLTGSQTLTNKTLTAPTINGWKADIVTASGTTLTTAQSGAYVIWTGGTCTLPASCVAGTQFTIFNNTGSSATVGLGGSNSILSGWASNAAVADHDATSYVAISSTNWVQVGA